ncbi:MAG: hypothetical protein LBC63_07245 [Holophagales bacterium]|jgi:hypothetical protein|nr:hypothetical protein [Holophagales bacterium]
MLFIIPPTQDPPAIQAQSQVPQTMESLEYQLLEAFDYGIAVGPPQLPSDRASDQAKLMWLHSAAHLPTPISTFEKNSLERAEADELLKFFEAKGVPTEQSLGKLGLKLTGSQLALWRFGQAAVRRGDWPPSVRREWEGRLLEEKIHPLIMGFALRHALCWALAENDEARLAELKGSKASQDMPEIFLVFQKAFSAIGGPTSALKLWTSDFKELHSGILAGGEAWICPDADFPPHDKAATWVVPLLEPQGIENAESPAWRGRAENFLELPILASYKVSFAPYQRDLSLLGIVFFPALIRLDEKGNIAKIQMGDACPRAVTGAGVMLSPNSNSL